MSGSDTAKTEPPHELRTPIWNHATRQWVPHVIRDYPEYARRNLLVAGAIGAGAALRTIKARLADRLTPAPVWLLIELDAIEERLTPLPADLARWRDLVGYELDAAAPAAAPAAGN